jgi:polyphosphate kinase
MTKRKAPAAEPAEAVAPVKAPAPSTATAPSTVPTPAPALAPAAISAPAKAPSRKKLPALDAPQLYLNREMAFLAFDQRVLELARDPAVPLLERVRFLSISCGNLDEFYEIRVAGLRQRLALALGDASLLAQLDAIRAATHELMDAQYRILDEEIRPGLSAAGLHLLRPEDVLGEGMEPLADYFVQEVEPVLSPLALDPARPFPRIQNKSLNFVVRLNGTDGFGRDTKLAVVQVPRSLPRVIVAPHGAFVLLSTVVQVFVDHLFPGVEVTGCWQFRVTRDSDLFVEEEEVDDLRRAVEGELAQRRYGDAVRLEVAHDTPEDITDLLLAQFELTRADLHHVHGPVNLNRLMGLVDLVDRPELKYPTFTSGMPHRLQGEENEPFDAIREKDILVHHPFQSFNTVVDFVNAAARDPQVLAIKQTLYRAGTDSEVVKALVHAARNGKDVTVVIELMARFDEAANIALATLLQEAGAHVMYGVVGYKTHAKLLMVVRRESDRLRRYCHLGTGNYHARTARTYTDYGLFTDDDDIGADVHAIFMQLTGLTKVPTLRRLLHSPFTLHEGLVMRIERETANARAGLPARIVAKMNALVEPQVIRALYTAAMAGVEIDLIIRGVCVLRPGMPGISERIRVRSVLGRFLEHSRVWWFANGSSNGPQAGGQHDKVVLREDPAELFLSSADWMDRNFFRRVEVAVPVLRPTHRARILRDLGAYLADNTNAWMMREDGTYVRAVPAAGEAPFTAQTFLLDHYQAP